MRISHLIPTVLTLLFAGTDLSAQSFKTFLTGRGESPPVVTAAYGEITAELVGDTLTLSGFFRDLTGEFAENIAGGMHIHSGYAGRNGGIAHGLKTEVDSGLRNGTLVADSNRVVLSQDQKNALFERALYINVHTSSWPSGEIRGQILPQSDLYFATTMLGSNENPAILTRARGALVFDVVEDTLTISGSFGGLSSPFNVNAGGGMHLHNGLAGQNGGISIGVNATVDSTELNATIRADNNRHTLTADQKAALIGRRLYANVHSETYAGGEIRGQVTGIALVVFRGHLSGMNETPFVPSRAGGMVVGELTADSTLWLSGSFAGIESGVAIDISGGGHIHSGVAGRNGGIQYPLNLDLNVDSTGATFAVDSNSYKLSEANFASLINRGLYVNVHSNLVRSGEIRAQLLPESQMAFNANLSSVTSIPPVRSPSAGLVKAELNGNLLTLTGSFSGLSSDLDTSIAGGVHLHMAMTGSTGPVIFPLNLRLDANLTQATLASNVLTLTDDQATALLARGLYINVHTHRYPAGEIRGQLLPEAATYFFASLAGGNESNPVRSEGIGQFALEVQRNGSVIGSGSFNNLQGELATNIAGGAHIHTGLNGQNGPVLMPIVPTASPDLHSGVFEAALNNYTFSPGLLDTLYHMGMYANVHSSFSPSGELRGQLLPAATAHFNAVLRPMNEVQPVDGSVAHGSLSAMLAGNLLRVTGSFAELTGDFAEHIAGGAHLHAARAGFNGPVSVPLDTRVAGDLKSGIFVSDTAYMLSPDQIQTLLSGGFYANLHTTHATSGELRGQVLSNFNEFPNAASEITQPIPNSTVVVSSTSFETLLISWTPSFDTDSLAYIVQVTPDPTFSLIPIQFNTGNQRTFNVLTLAAIDTLLANFGIPIGFPVSVNARIIASDGSLQSIGQAFSFTLVREPASAVRDLPEGWSFEVYPTLAQQEVYVDIVAPNARYLDVVLISASGQKSVGNMPELMGNESYHVQFEVDQLSPGLWIVGLMDNGSLVGHHKILIVK